MRVARVLGTLVLPLAPIGWRDIVCRCCFATYARMRECRGFRCVKCGSWNHGEF